MPEHKEQNISASFISHLRQNSRVSCPVSSCGEQMVAIDDRIRDHLYSKHRDYIEGKDINLLIREIKRGRKPSAQPNEPPSPTQASPSIRNRPRSTSPKRSRARPQQHTPSHDPDFTPRGPQQGKLWNPEADSSPSHHRQKQSSAKSAKAPATPKRDEPLEEDLRLIKQPETRPISQEQLVAEVKGIYAGLMMVESKCIEVDNAQSSQNDSKLNNEQWQALIALHRTLLHEHHDFFLASQHPSASLALKRLASKYAMPARMWRHGIHSFLELLRHRLPGSIEHMLTFIYMAYSMMALLYETVPAFEDTWIECLGDLGRYRMAIEDDDIRDREVWTSVSRHWYSKASDKAPTTGRLYHHLAILARPNALQQLFYYTKSLCVPIPFASAKESIMTLFDPILNDSYQHGRIGPLDIAFVKIHGSLFIRKKSDDFFQFVHEFHGSLDKHIGRLTKRWMEAGYYIAIANCCALLSYGREENVIMRSIQNQTDESQHQEGMVSGANTLSPSESFENAVYFVMGTHQVVFSRWGDENVLPYVHVVMVFMFYLIRIPVALRQLEHRFPWKLLSLMLNDLIKQYENYDRIRSDVFPRESDNPPRPVPEDFALKGHLFVGQYYPSDWFSNDKIDDDEKYFEMPSMTDVRKERILWLGYRIAQSGRCLTYDEDTNRFGVSPEYEQETGEFSKDVDMLNISDNTNFPALSQPGVSDSMDIDDQPCI
ncbi:hypothetical protein NUW58_g6658 [Xylaria curta]|uniref:Uncharacterized protein n=1 Tax=Xylaria curta TaxID=42375 RepID=A0ACC1NRT9_9PEZI|nr:hypothetical protein NUW58_g6658 [Xylaria curta]